MTKKRNRPLAAERDFLIQRPFHLTHRSLAAFDASIGALRQRSFA